MVVEHILQLFLDETLAELEVSPISNGHINNTFQIVRKADNRRFILQKINTNIFPFPENIAHNHLTINNILKANGYSKVIVEPVLTKKGNYVDEKEGCWRMLEFIEGSKTFLMVPDAETAFEATKALSEFYYILNNNADGVEIKDPLPGFINFQKRLNDYRTALENAPAELKESAKAEIEFVNANDHIPQGWISKDKEGLLPKRIIHADPKISNILFDEENRTLAVIDLDTIMEGTLLYDFGDMIRSYTNTSEEDDGKVAENFSAEIFEKVKQGFLSHLDNFLQPVEKDLLDDAAASVIYIQAVRFLTDYLNGSVYYSIKYPEHNLDRTKNQITLVKGLLAYLNK